MKDTTDISSIVSAITRASIHLWGVNSPSCHMMKKETSSVMILYASVSAIS